MIPCNRLHKFSKAFGFLEKVMDLRAELIFNASQES